MIENFDCNIWQFLGFGATMFLGGLSLGRSIWCDWHDAKS